MGGGEHPSVQGVAGGGLVPLPSATPPCPDSSSLPACLVQMPLALAVLDLAAGRGAWGVCILQARRVSPFYEGS